MEQAVQNPDVISLAAGLVDPSTLPVAEARMTCAALLSDDHRARAALQYGTTPGYGGFRETLRRHLSLQEGRPVEKLGIDIGQILLTTGSQQLLSLVGEVLIDPGDIVFVAAPTYFVFLGTLNGLGARVISIPSDEQGMQTDLLDAEFRKIEAAGELSRVKLIYLVSYYENPTGISLSAERRQRVVEIARGWSKSQRIFILEDAAYRELRYDGPELPSVWSFDTDRRTVILANTFSKSFSPGLRVGWGVVPSELVGPLNDRKGNEDFGSSNFSQHLLATVFGEGLYQEHVQLLRDTYCAKRDAMLAAAENWFSEIPGVDWVHPHGGLYVWMSLPDALDTGFGSPLFRRATEIDKVMYVPGEVCYSGDPASRPKTQMRLSFGTQVGVGI
jgi:2-aminoadipate transaminase